MIHFQGILVFLKAKTATNPTGREPKNMHIERPRLWPCVAIEDTRL